MEKTLHDILLDNKCSQDTFGKILGENYGFSRRKNNNAYNRIIKYKVKTIMKPLFGSKKPIFKIPHIAEEEYSNCIFNTLKEHIQEEKVFYQKNVSKKIGDDFIKDMEMKLSFLNQIDMNEIYTNRIAKPLMFIGKTFPEGMRATRAINKVLATKVKSETQSNTQSKLLGVLKLNPKDKKDIYLTIKPESMIYGGVKGDSCLSPEGENEESLLMYPSSAYTAMLHTEDFSWRAWVLVDTKTKKYSILKGYPFENFYAQVAAHSFFQAMSYEMVHSYVFRLDAIYTEGVGGIAGATGLLKPISYRIHEQKFLNIDLMTGLKIKNSVFSNIQAAVCDGCGRMEWGEEQSYFEDGLCEICQEWHND